HTEAPVRSDPGHEVAGVREAFADFADPMVTALRQLDVAEPVHFGPAEEVDRDQWHAGRVLLIGDAAHSCSPILAQGASLAMEDGVVLSVLLADAEDIDSALAQF